MSRQHRIPLLIKAGQAQAIQLAPLNLQGGGVSVSELKIQTLVQEHPECLPIAEIDPIFANPVPICMELDTVVAGFIDNFMVTPTGLPVLVECKLWRNPEARREIVGQILDYAKEISRWSAADLHRVVNRHLKKQGSTLLDLMRKAHPTIDEITFNDDLTRNLRRGRFLLLIVGDGIREGVESIAEYLQDHAGLHFSMGLVEFPIYQLPDGGLLVAPRVLLRTSVIVRNLIKLPDGFMVGEPEGGESVEEIDTERAALGDEQQSFWSKFLTYLKLDDPEQPIPRPPRAGNIAFSMPAPGGTSWLTVYRDQKKNELGVFLSSWRNTVGEQAMESIGQDWEVVKAELGGSAYLSKKDGRSRPSDSKIIPALQNPENLHQGMIWLAERVNTFVNVMRPRVRSIVADIQDSKTNQRS